eukprot:TRINITY_DN23514_c0_g1_i4.p1 TRINITY_DN23514_c0_g1~~TRINITY_DN23514_c0_g1_i4.p1  ORF type:complete len:930 (+),score=148.53 TRINITY_DN23514_c0_g1_i4:150-2939(+)
MGSSLGSCGEGISAVFGYEDGDFPVLADLCSLDACLQTGDIVLVKGSWLLGQKYDGTAWLNGLFRGELGKAVFPRRQDLPEEAVWSLDELRPRLALGSRRVKLVSVSYRWLGKNHPDPHAEQLRTLLKVIELWYCFFAREFSWDLAIFIDQCSLYQEPRLPWEEASFRRALEDVPLFYAHQWTDVWMLPDPGEVEKASRPVDSKLRSALSPSSNKWGFSSNGRAWSMFERTVSTLTPSGATRSVMDLAWFTDSCTDWESIEAACCLERSLPTTPKAFKEMIQRAHCSVEANKPLIVKLYTETFRLATCSTKDLFYQSLNIGDVGAEELEQILRSCSRLSNLFLSDNRIGDTGATLLALALPTCRELNVLALDDNNIGPEGAMRLAVALPSCRQLFELRLSGNASLGDSGVEALAAGVASCGNMKCLAFDGVGLSDDGSANVLPKFGKCRGLVQLNLAENRIGDNGAVAIAGTMSEWRRLEQLVLSDNCIGDRGVAALSDGSRKCRLNVLQLSRNSITDVGLEKLVPAFSSCKKLATLSLEGNDLNDEAVISSVHEAWATAGKRKSGLRLPQKWSMNSPRRVPSRTRNSRVTFLLPGGGTVLPEPPTPRLETDAVLVEQNADEVARYDRHFVDSEQDQVKQEDSWVLLDNQKSQADDQGADLPWRATSEISSIGGYTGSVVEVTVSFEDRDLVAKQMHEAFEVAGIQNYPALVIDDFYVTDALGRATEPKDAVNEPFDTASFPMTWRYAPASSGPIMRLRSASCSGSDRVVSDFLPQQRRFRKRTASLNSLPTSLEESLKKASASPRVVGHSGEAEWRSKVVHSFSAVVTGRSQENDFVIEVRGPNIWHTVVRTFCEFLTLHSRFKAYTGIPPPLPPRRTVWTYFDLTFMDKRQEQLGRLIAVFVMSDPRLNDPDLREFLCVAPAGKMRA